MQNTLTAAKTLYEHMEGMLLPKLLTLPAGVAMYAVMAVLGALPALFQEPKLVWLGGGVFAASALFVVLRSAIKMLSVRQMMRLAAALAASLERSEAAAERSRQQAQEDYDRRVGELRD